MNDQLHITDEIARAESPTLLAPRDGARMTAWVGADERPAFLGQSADFARAWGPDVTDCVIEPCKHHFDVIDGLADPGSALMEAALAG